jgi:probable phosphoglycerate mutase
VSRVLDTQLPGAPLTEQGAAQARALGTRLAPPAVLISSVALRAQQTAALLGAETGVPVQVLNGLHEVQVGDLEGRNDRVALETFGAIFLAWETGDFAPVRPAGNRRTNCWIATSRPWQGCGSGTSTEPPRTVWAPVTS